MPTASTAKLRNQVEEFKKARGWTEEQFTQKTANWDQADFDELANGFIRQQTLSKREAKFKDDLAAADAKRDAEYSGKFAELARLQAAAKDAAENGTARAQQIANKLVNEFKANAVQWAKDNELDPAKLMTTNFDDVIKAELGAPSNGNNNNGHRQQPNDNNSQSNGQGKLLTPEQVQQMISDAIGGGAGRLTAMQEKIEDYNEEFGLKGKNRVTVSKFNNYANENGIAVTTMSDLESVLEEMTDAPTKRQSKAEADREQWYNERHQKDMTVEIEKRFGNSANLANQMAASNIPQREKSPIFRREMAGHVTDSGQGQNNGGGQQQTNNAPPPEHKGPPPERTLAERRSAVIAGLNQKYSQQSGQSGQSG